MQISSIVPMRSDYHVVPYNVYWLVKQEHRALPWGTFLTKTEALAEGIAQARQGHVSLVVHGRDGRVQYVTSYDTAPDPFR